MLSLTMGAMAITIVVIMVGFGFYMLAAEQRRGQGAADQLTLSLATSLNSYDKIGQINNVVARCRELVYVSRQNVDLAQQNGGTMQPLANQLLDEARNSALLVDAERINQLGIITSSIKFAVDQYNLNSQNTPFMNLPMFQSYKPNVTDVAYGYVDKVESNVENMNVIQGLRSFDSQAGYFQAGSNLYKGNINARLPTPDNDLNFKISSLPADVQAFVTPARLASPAVFKQTAQVYKDGSFAGAATDMLPSSIYLQAAMPVMIKGSLQQVQVKSMAQTSGGNPAP